MLSALVFAAAAANATSGLPGFMTGCWDLVEGEHWTHECWMEPKAGLMLGASREGASAKLKSWEQMRIEQSAVGKITLFASPQGRAAVPFEGRTISPSAIEFTNARHDYPQRIRYELKGETLVAEISLIDGSKAIRWTYVREKP